MAESPYPAEKTDVVCESPDVRVAEITLPPLARVPTHRHTRSQEICWCLEGQLTWHTPDEAEHTLQPGERKTFPADQEHTLLNRREAPCRFLLVHGVGAFDFVKSP